MQAAGRAVDWKKKKKARETALKVFRTFSLSIFSLAMVFPFVWMISSSLKTRLSVYEFPFRLIPEAPKWGNYARVWNDRYYPMSQMYLNSIFVTFLSILLMLLISSLAAYAFAKIDFRGKNALFMLLLATMMVPSQMMMIPRFILFNYLGLYNSLWALVFCHLINVLSVFLLRQSFVTLPNELSEAAKIDGASHLQIWARIVAPLAKPAFLSLLILSFVWFWNDYENPLIFIRSKQYYTIPIGLHVYRDAEENTIELICTCATLAIIPVLAVFLFFQKHFMEGIVTTGLKG